MHGAKINYIVKEVKKQKQGSDYCQYLGNEHIYGGGERCNMIENDMFQGYFFF